MPPSRRGRGRGKGGRPYDRSQKSDIWELFGGGSSDEEIDDQPDVLYTCVDQVWSRCDEWITKEPESPSVHVSVDSRLIFEACNRVYGALGPSIDDHTWINLKSHALTELLRYEENLKGVGDLLDNRPGLDARSLFLRLPRLKELAAEPSPEDDVAPVSTHLSPVSSPSSGLKLDNVSTLSPAPAPALEDVPGPVVASGATMEIDPGLDDLADTFPLPTLDEYDDPPATTEPPLSAPVQLFILTKFIEEHFKDTVAEFERLKAEGYTSFKLLWILCPSGAIIEVPDDETGDRAGMKVEFWEYGNDGRTLTVTGIKYVWDGTVFKKEQTRVCVGEFQGFVKLDQLPIKVLSDQARHKLIERGKLYQKFAGVHHLSYNSFVLVPARCGYAKVPATGRIMIDVAGYYQFCFGASGGPRDTGDWGGDTPVRRSIGAIADEYKPSELLPDEVLCLTPPSLFGWSFRAKQWGLIHVEHVEEIVFNETAFDQLVLKKSYKKMVKALVETHAGKEDGLAKDLIAGKGGGMVMVLHGKPGTGKALTAEAISEHLKCPLYVVSSGELGIEASSLEKQLKDTLEMAASWGAVVLIDEADVFLEARDTHDLARNSLVSVFLRLLEYHQGVLILTTNRIRSFDRAFVSRFTIALNYPDLDQNSRLLIWKEFLRRAGFNFGDPSDATPSRPLYIAHSDLMAVAGKPFNGRVIKQLVRGAQALAIAEKEPLELSHIHTVLEITEQFEADWEDMGLVAEVREPVTPMP